MPLSINKLLLLLLRISSSRLLQGMHSLDAISFRLDQNATPLIAGMFPRTAMSVPGSGRGGRRKYHTISPPPWPSG